MLESVRRLQNRGLNLGGRIVAKEAVVGENSPPAYSLIISIRGLPNGITFRMALTSHNLKGKGQEASLDIFQNHKI